MDEYIKRKDAFDILQSRLDSISQMSYLDMDWHELDIMRNAIENAIDDVGEVPSVDVQPVKHGEWIFQGRRDEDGRNIYHCSGCNFEVGVFPCNFISWRTHEKYCPGCGARMDGDSE